MRELAVERIPIEVDRAGLNPLADLRLLIRYRTLLKRLRPAAYLSYTIKPNIYGSFAAASLGIPALPNVSGLGTAFIQGGPLQAMVTRLYRLGFARAPVVFFQNEEDRSLFVSRRIVRQTRRACFPAPASISNISRRRRCMAVLRPSSSSVGCCATRAWSSSSRRPARSGPNTPRLGFSCWVQWTRGTGPRSASPRSSSWLAEGVVEQLGPTDDVRPFIAAASAVVLPSYREGLPRSLLEAAAMAPAVDRQPTCLAAAMSSRTA